MNTITYITILILIGCGSIFLRKWIASSVIDFQDRVYGFHFGGKNIRKIYEMLSILIGLIAIIYAVLAFFGINTDGLSEGLSSNVLHPIFSIVIGLGFIIFKKWLTEDITDRRGQRTVYFAGKSKRQLYEILMVIIGVIAIFYGLLSFFWSRA